MYPEQLTVPTTPVDMLTVDVGFVIWLWASIS